MAACLLSTVVTILLSARVQTAITSAACPTWVEGMVGDKYVRHSLKTRSWERAVAKVRKMDATEDATPAPAKKDEPVNIERAVNEYLADAKARELGEATLYKLNIIFRKQLLAWSKAEGYKLLREFNLRAVQAYRATWKDGALAKKKTRTTHRLLLVLHSCWMDYSKPYEWPGAHHCESDANGLLHA